MAYGMKFIDLSLAEQHGRCEDFMQAPFYLYFNSFLQQMPALCLNSQV